LQKHYCHGCWSGIREKNTEQREYTIDELKEDFGMSVIEWDGR
jgi:hypothetical protein